MSSIWTRMVDGNTSEVIKHPSLFAFCAVVWDFFGGLQFSHLFMSIHFNRSRFQDYVSCAVFLVFASWWSYLLARAIRRLRDAAPLPQAAALAQTTTRAGAEIPAFGADD